MEETAEPESGPFGFGMVAEIARRSKREAQRNHGERHALLAQVMACRAGMPICQLISDPEVEDAIAPTLFQGAALFRADELFLIADGITHAREAWGEGFGSYRRGRMQERWYAGEREGLTEALIISRFAPGQAPQLALFPYLIDTYGGLVWLEPLAPGDVSADGFLPDVARQGFDAARRVAAAFEEPPELAELPETERELVKDRAAARAASQAEGVGLVGCYGLPRDDRACAPVSFFQQGQEMELPR